MAHGCSRPSRRPTSLNARNLEDRPRHDVWGGNPRPGLRWASEPRRSRQLLLGRATVEPPKKSYLQRGRGTSVSGAPMLKCSRDRMRCGLLPFLRGTGVDHNGRKLNEILEWDDTKLESVHNYIQWLFPTDEASRWNVGAPVLSPSLLATLKTDPLVRENILTALKRFLQFLGLELVSVDGDASPSAVQKAPHFESRIPTCWQSSFMRNGGNHNWLRISRVLHCLNLVDLFEEASALHTFLEKLYAQGLPCGSSIDHWRRNARKCSRIG